MASHRTHASQNNPRSTSMAGRLTAGLDAPVLLGPRVPGVRGRVLVQQVLPGRRGRELGRPVGPAALGQALDDGVKAGLEEEGDAVALHARGVDHAVPRGLELAVGPLWAGAKRGLGRVTGQAQGQDAGQLLRPRPLPSPQCLCTSSATRTKTEHHTARAPVGRATATPHARACAHPLNHVPQVDDEAAGQVPHVGPALALLVDLQAWHLIRCQHRQHPAHGCDHARGQHGRALTGGCTR